MNSTPPSLSPIGRPSSSSSGRGGIMPPSHQVSLTSGMPSRGRKLDSGRWSSAGYFSFFGSVFSHKSLPVGRDTAFHAHGILQFQGPEGGVEDVASQVAQRAGAEVPPRPPVARMIRRDDRGDRPPDRSTGPNRATAGRAAFPSDARPRCPAARRGDWSRHAPRGPLRWPRSRSTRRVNRDAVAGVPLVAHLGGDLVFAGGLGEQPGLVDAMGERLLHVDVLAALDGRQGDHGMRVIGRGHDHGVDVLLLVEHDAEIRVTLGPRILGEGLGGVIRHRRRRGPRCSRSRRRARLLLPMPPTPTPAMFSFSLGEVLPLAATT